MRLVNTKTFKLEEFSDGSIPPYAILSHTWGKDSEELSFRDVEAGKIDKPGVGSTKLQGCCHQAKEDKLGYAWIDTCCIDKTNLVELSEAINSMFRWYSRASVCYAYLSDVPGDDEPRKPKSKFQTSRWFQRGWTLQELLAPKHLRFYNSEWKCIGTKGTISNLIKNITRVPRPFLLGITELHVASVAQRMSWAAQRETKRPEDLAYCLLGIFGIAMPLIYGEGGEQAFFRLQEQIMKTTRDDSLLAWDLDVIFNESYIRDRAGGILAPNPSHFADSGQIVSREHTQGPLNSLEVFGGSLRISLPLLTTASGETFGLLNCGPGASPHKVVGIPLAKETPVTSDEYVRPRGLPSVLRTVAASGPPPELIHIKKDGQNDIFINRKKQYWLYEDDLFAQFNLTLVDVEPPSCWDKQTNLISPISSNEAATNQILLRFCHNEAESQDFVTILEEPQPDSNADPQLNTVICNTVTCSRSTPLLEIAKSLQDISPEESGTRGARNEMLHLRIKLVPMEGGIISINPEAISTISYDTALDTSKSADLILDFKQLLRDRRQLNTKREEIEAKSQDYNQHLRRARESREEVEHQIKELEIRMRTLVEEERDCAQEIYYLGEEQKGIEERQEYLSNQLSRAHTQLEDLDFASRCQVGSTLLQEPLEPSDAEVAKLLLYKVDDMEAANDDGWIPLVAASIRGDVDAVRQLLAASGVEPDGKGSMFGRTALSWASANGHKAVVQLLLDTGKVDVNSRDNNSWSPLRWARQQKFDDVAQLLLTNSANIDCQQTLRGHTRPIHTVAISHDSKLIVSGSGDGTIKIWDNITGKCYQTLQGLTETVAAVAISHDSKLIVSGSYDDTIKTWNTVTGQCLQTLHGHERIVTSVAFSHDSKLIVSGSSDSIIKTWNTVTGQCLQTLHGHKSGVESAAFSHDSKLIISGSYDHTIKTWNTMTGQCLQTLHGHESSVKSVAFSHDSKLIVSGSYDNTIKTWNTVTGQCLQTHGHESCVESVAFSHDSKFIVSGSHDNTNKIWDNITGKHQITLYGHERSVSSVAFSHDSKFIVSGSSDRTIKIWDISMVTNPEVTGTKKMENIPNSQPGE